MKKINFKRTVSVFLVLLMILSFAACTTEDASSSVSESLSEEASSQASLEESLEDALSSEESSQNESSDISDVSDISEATSSEDLSAENSSEDLSEGSSEEISEAQSEDASSQQPDQSEDNSSSADVSTLNPYFGTDIKPAEGKVIAFTFDDGPSYTDSTNKILDKLEELGMSATFFVVGNRVSAKTSPTIKRMIDLGCDIGNHSYNHPNFNSMTVSAVKKQIDDTNANLEKHVGVKATLIRPPYGNITDSQMSSLNTPIICWDIDTLDWDLKNAQKIYDRTISKVHSGGIVLMHDIYDTTAEAFCMLADELVSQGYTLVTVSELLGTEKLMCTTIKYGFKW